MLCKKNLFFGSKNVSQMKMRRVRRTYGSDHGHHHVKKVEAGPVDVELDGFDGGYGIALHSPTWTKHFAEILATEGEIPIPQLTAEHLHTLYVKQLEDFLKSKEEMLKEKVTDENFEGLKRIYTLRAAFPLETIQKALDEVGVTQFQKGGMKKSISEAFPDPYNNSTNPEGEGYFARWNGTKKSGVPFKATYPKNLLSGIAGLVKALDGGFSKEQIAKTKSILASTSGDIIQLDRPSTNIEIGKSNTERRNLLKQGKVNEAYPNPDTITDKDVKEEAKKFIESQKSVWSKPNAEEFLELTHIVSNSDSVTYDKAEQVFAAFSDKNVKDDEAILKKISQLNPVADALLRNNLVALAVPGITYTEDFQEVSGMRATTTDPSVTPGRQNWNPTTAIFNSNVGLNLPNYAAEQIIDLKLERLATFYGLNINNDIDAVKFNMFMHEFEVSPGEYGLDWVMQYPPDHHTYEELPIVKIPSDEDVEDYYKSEEH